MSSHIQIISNLFQETCLISTFSRWSDSQRKEQIDRYGKMLSDINEYRIVNKYRKHLPVYVKNELMNSIANKPYRLRILPDDIVVLVSRSYKVNGRIIDSDFATFEPRNKDKKILDSFLLKNEDVVIHKNQELDKYKNIKDYGLNHGEPVTIIFSMHEVGI